MSYDIKIYNPKDLKSRSYLNIKVNNRWIKEYNGNKINIDIKPNLAKTYRKRASLLKQLEYSFRKAIEQNSYPVKENNRKMYTTEYLLKKALEKKVSLKLNHNYLRNLQYILDDFLSFLTNKEKNSPLNLISKNRIQEFLLNYNSSGTYYMNKRRDLGVLFSQVAKDFDVEIPSIKSTEKMKSKPDLHHIYTNHQLTTVLKFLKKWHKNLHLCCLISYGCLLRPHQEIRKLTKNHFKNDYTEIHLSAKENKSGRPRIVYVPDYVRTLILLNVAKLDENSNIFSKKTTPFNEAYFSTAWKRAYPIMLKTKIIDKKHTIYSFRHTSAVQVYQKTKDLYLLQQLMGHSDMVTTLKYLRGLGAHNLEELKHIAPTL